jgi:hypothetical protein
VLGVPKIKARYDKKLQNELATIEEIKKSHVIYVSPIKCINVKK